MTQQTQHTTSPLSLTLDLPKAMQDALAIWLSQAAVRSGITDRRQRIALQAELLALMGE
jgi:hypothetical protein